MKVLMLCDFYNEKLEFQENILTKYYTKHGHDVTVVTSTFESVFDYYEGRHDASIPRREYFDGKAKIIKLPYKFNILNRIRPFVLIKDILEDECPDLIYVHDIVPNMLEALPYMKRNPQVRMIMDYHADYSNSGKNWLSIKVLHGVVRRGILNRCLPKISRIFPVVPAGITFLHEVYGVDPGQMEVLPLGADVDAGAHARQSERLPDLRENYGISSDKKVIITGGKLSPRKKTELLIRAMHELEEEGWCLLIIGKASDQDAEYKQVLDQAIDGDSRIHYTGWLSSYEVYEHLAISDIAVFPASQSIIWQQAISMGLPLIVGDTGGQSVEYLNGQNNIVMLEKDAITTGNIRNAIERVWGDNDLYHSMSEGAKKVTQECLDWNHLIDRTLRFNK